MDQNKVLVRAEVPRALKQAFFALLASQGKQFTSWVIREMQLQIRFNEEEKNKSSV